MNTFNFLRGKEIGLSVQFILFFIAILIFSSEAIAEISRERKTDFGVPCGEYRQCYEKEENNKRGIFNPIDASKLEPRITTGMIYYWYEDGFVGKLKGSMPFIGGGLLTSFREEKWIIDLYGQTSSIDTQSSKRNIPFISKKIDTFQGRDIKRDDYTFSLGYNCLDKMDHIDIADNLWVFLGYRGGKTAINTKAIVFENKVTGDNRSSASELDVDISFKTMGPFIGFMIGKKIGSSQVGISYGYTRLNGEYSFKESKQIQPDSKESFVSGHKSGIDWNVPLTNINSRTTLRFNLSLNFYQYKMNVKRTSFFENLEAEFPVTERSYSLRAAFLFQGW